MKVIGTMLLSLASSLAMAQASNFHIYQELPDPARVDLATWEQVDKGIHAAFGDADTRYPKHVVPGATPLQTTWEATAWKGERVHTQLVLWTAGAQAGVSIALSPLKDERGHQIDRARISAGFLRYVMTDELNKDGTGCGYRKAKDFDSSLVADAIDCVAATDIPANTTQPVWLSVDVPAGTPAGTYRGYLKVRIGANFYPQMLHYTIHVKDRVLPAPAARKFHLDLWQSPDAVARMYDVPKWSAAHYKAMAPYMQLLAAAGQKVITTSIIYDPWNAQTEDIYASTVKWTKKKDGSWGYDYSVFDAWISFMMRQGIAKQINCYSMIPWNLKFYYYDEAAGKDTFLVAKTSAPEYAAHWKPMLADFARHLKAKGWFDKTVIAMDERPLKDMQDAIALIKSVDKQFKISLAGNYHPEIVTDIYDYCVASNQEVPAAVKEQRRAGGLLTTYYTCCTEGYPNTFTFSPPAEAAWLPWHAALKGYDGYLRWAYNSWVQRPMQDSRFRSWAAGDTYFVYPGVRSSMRFERLLEGVQDYEKIRVLREEFRQTGNTEALRQLEELLSVFELERLKTEPAAEMLRKAKAGLNKL